MVYPDSTGIPDQKTIISEPIYVKAGTTENLAIKLVNSPSIYTRFDKVHVWIMLHTDDGVQGTFEYDNINGKDMPIVDEDGKIISKKIILTPPYITAENQKINGSVEVTVQTAVAGWLVAYKTTTGNDRIRIIGKTQVEAGFKGKIRFNVDIYLEEYEKYILVDLHIDDGIIGKFEYPHADSNEYYGINRWGHNQKEIISRLVWDEK
ncbi:MAG: hypothetical protein CVV25_03600 [Ignavibacteriae bacterium HGW-Ignavibacteriae-4]|nr:MAG: hypothetical protein CVV25_03600 [Ignavibacteriae bacterium HGW-Ignavibacteriae-4]